MTFSKFRPLEHNGGNQIYGLDKKLKDDKFTNNYRFGKILKTSKLHASTFDNFNDIDEGRFCIFGTYNKNQIFLETIRNTKLGQYVCSFSYPNSREFCEDLMWAHYANHHCGVRIDFEISEPLPENIKKVEYINQQTEIEIKKLKLKLKLKQTQIEIEKRKLKFTEDDIRKLLSKKKRCWKYEQEYRAFTHNDKFPIKISKITLGKKFSTLTATDDDIENGEFSTNIKSVARQISEILIKTRKYTKENLPEIWAYKTLYSPQAHKVLDEKEIENLF